MGEYGSVPGGMKHNETAEPITESDLVLSNRELPVSTLSHVVSLDKVFRASIPVSIYRELPVEIDVLKKMLTVNRSP